MKYSHIFQVNVELCEGRCDLLWLYNSVEFSPGQRLWKHSIYVGPWGFRLLCVSSEYVWRLFNKASFLRFTLNCPYQNRMLPPSHLSFLAEQTCQFEVPVDVFVGFGYVFPPVQHIELMNEHSKKHTRQYFMLLFCYMSAEFSSIYCLKTKVCSCVLPFPNYRFPGNCKVSSLPVIKPHSDSLKRQVNIPFTLTLPDNSKIWNQQTTQIGYERVRNIFQFSTYVNFYIRNPPPPTHKGVYLTSFFQRELGSSSRGNVPNTNPQMHNFPWTFRSLWHSPGCSVVSSEWCVAINRWF